MNSIFYFAEQPVKPALRILRRAILNDGVDEGTLRIAEEIIAPLRHIFNLLTAVHLPWIYVQDHHILCPLYLLCHGYHRTLKAGVCVHICVNHFPACLYRLPIPLRLFCLEGDVPLPVCSSHDLSVDRGVGLHILDSCSITEIFQIFTKPGRNILRPVVRAKADLQCIQHCLVFFVVIHLIRCKPPGNLYA